MMAYTADEINRLPVEVLLKVLSNLDSNDIQRCRHICQQWNCIIVKNWIYLARIPIRCQILTATDGSILIQLQKYGMNAIYTSTTENFDAKILQQFELQFLEISSIDSTTNPAANTAILHRLCESILQTRQQRLRALKLYSLHITEHIESSFLRLLECFNGTEVTVENCNLTKAIFSKILKQVKNVKNFKWINSFLVDRTECADQLIYNLTDVIKQKYCERHNSFTIEAENLSPKAICGFLEAWLNAKEAPFFVFTIRRCLDDWKLMFLDECKQRNLSQYSYEFQSKENKLSHVKVRFINQSSSCELCPIFDVPARLAGQLFCYTRYFRDF